MQQFGVLKKDTVCRVLVDISQTELTDIIDCLNKRELDEEGDISLTIEEVLSKPELLGYLVKEAVQDGVALFDPDEFWNNDGWCDFRDYR